MSATAQLITVFVIAVAPDPDRAECIAHSEPTTEVGSTVGAQINAEALCIA